LFAFAGTLAADAADCHGREAICMTIL